jgi:hypothetical protein
VVDSGVLKMAQVLKETLEERSIALNLCRNVEATLFDLQQGYKFTPVEDISVHCFSNITKLFHIMKEIFF